MIPIAPPLFFSAWRATLRAGMSRNHVLRDIVAGIIVGITSLPLSMAFAISAGMTPQSGLYTAIIGGFIAGFVGGSRYQISGPTAAFVVILLPIVHSMGVAGLLLATGLAGIFLLLMGLLRLGKLIDFVSFPVIAGFTFGISLSVIILQLRTLLGVTAPATVHIVDEVRMVYTNMSTMNWCDTLVGVFTLISLFTWRRFITIVPGTLVVLPLSALLAVIMARINPAWQPLTVENHFSTIIDGVKIFGIPTGAPHFDFPWNLSDPTKLRYDFEHINLIVRAAVAIALLSAIETLITAVCADRLTGTRHNPDGELVSHGLANIVAPFFGGFATSGAIPRTAANIQSGGTSPLASAMHSISLLLVVLFLAKWLGYLPMAGMAGLLIFIAYYMSDSAKCWSIIRTSARAESFTLLMCVVLTVWFDMVIAIGAGVVLTSILFMQKMSNLAVTENTLQVPDSNAQKVAPEIDPVKVPEGILYFKVEGALFFGAAQRTMGVIEPKPGAFGAVIDMRDVPMIDSTGLTLLTTSIDRLVKAGLTVVLVGVQPEPKTVFDAAGFRETNPNVRFFLVLSEAFRVLLLTKDQQTYYRAAAHTSS